MVCNQPTQTSQGVKRQEEKKHQIKLTSVHFFFLMQNEQFDKEAREKTEK